MRTLRTKREIEAFLRRLARRGGGVSAEVLRSTERILSAVRRQGYRALRRYTKRFDGHERLRVSPAERRRAAARADRDVVRALGSAAARIRRFHRLQKESSWSVREEGARLGQLVLPIERAGIYVPGGTAAYPSSVLMNVIPAQVAGVREVAVTVPAPGGDLDPHVMVALDLLGVEEVYSVGGAQAVAALAYGTETIRPVDKITGPGNIYVAVAKRLVYGQVDIDMIAGPSEILIIADETADPAFVAADILSQAEHDRLASSVLLTDTPVLAEAVRRELGAQVARLPRSEIARRSLRAYGAIILVKDLAEAVELANRIAPEHLEVMTKAPRRLARGLRNAGAVFLGPWTPEPLGDYAAGPNHTLPTGATARWASALGVYDFLKRTSLIQFDRRGFRRLARTVETLARSEGLEAHARSVSVRRERLGG
jgi:histidinol dehydrogenase